jgi:hypothetical protein
MRQESRQNASIAGPEPQNTAKQQRIDFGFERVEEVQRVCRRKSKSGRLDQDDRGRDTGTKPFDLDQVSNTMGHSR